MLWSCCAVSTMEAQPDFKELLGLLNEHEVEYLIVGGYALAFHGAPRYTGDIDILVRPEAANAARVIEALADFGFRFSNLSAADFESPNQVVQLGVPPVRVDLITSITGISWEAAEVTKAPGKFGDIPVYYLGREQLIANKRAIGRAKDLADLEALGEQ